MKNLKFFTCKRHDALTWKNPWIDIKLHDLVFWTQVEPKENQDKKKKIVENEKQIKLEHKENSKWMIMLYKGSPFIHGWMKLCYNWDVNELSTMQVNIVSSSFQL